MELKATTNGFKNPTSICAILLLGVFTFLFLGAEYHYVNMIALTAGEQKTVIAQNYSLGVSVAGFLLYPLFRRFFKDRAQTAGLSVLALGVAACICLIQKRISYRVTLLSGVVLFLFLGLLGGAAHYLFLRLSDDQERLARMVGISYALGIFLQFLNNNLVNREAAEAIILSLFGFVLLALLLRAERLLDGSATVAEAAIVPASEEDKKKLRAKNISGALLALLIVLMACIFSTLDNAVTMYHVAGTDIGQWPRLLLAASGLAAGFLFDIRSRKFMTVIMYCITLMSVICEVVLKLGGPFLIGLIVFYLSAGFFVVFFTTSFLDFARHMPAPEFWTGMGRAMNNLSAALFSNISVALLVSDRGGMATIILGQVLFVAITVVICLLTARMPVSPDTPKAIPENLDPQEAFHILSELLELTPREITVFDKLVNSEESIQEIADGLYLSRRTCQRHIAAIYEKAGVKSRMGLYQLYIEKQRKP